MKETDTVHAIVPKYLHGQLVPDNTAELSRPLHALEHLLIAESLPVGSHDRDANIWAFNAIVKRESPEDKRETNRLVALHHRTN